VYSIELAAKGRAVLADQLRDCFLQQAEIEGRAVVLARHLSRSMILSAEERDFARDILRPEEALHMKMALNFARFFGSINRSRLRDALRRMVETLKSDAQEAQAIPLDYLLVMRLNHDERFLLRTFPAYRRIAFCFLPRELANAAGQLEHDERAHKIWSDSVLHRLNGEYPGWIDVARGQRTIRGHPLHHVATQLTEVYKAVSSV